MSEKTRTKISKTVELIKIADSDENEKEKEAMEE